LRPTFRRNLSPPFHGRRNRFSKPASKQLATSSVESREAYEEYHLLGYDAISQKMIHFITTAVETSNPTNIMLNFPLDIIIVTQGFEKVI
jgi:hypothetical protein